MTPKKALYIGVIALIAIAVASRVPQIGTVVFNQ